MRVVTVSDGRRLRVDAEQIVRHGLAPGEAIDGALVTRLAARDLYLRARDTALRILAVRSRSAAEMRARLRLKRIPEPLIRALLRDLGSLGYLDDLAFARAWIAGRRARRPSGIRRLRWELREKGVPGALIDQALREAGEGEGGIATEERGARTLVERRLRAYRGLTPDRRARRIAGLLQRRGFAPETIARVLRTLGRSAVEEATDA